MSVILDFIFPKTCYGCHRPLGYLCPVCQLSLKHLSICVSTTQPAEGRLSLFKYHPPLKSILSDLKYKFVSDVASEVVSISATTIKSDFPHLLSYWQQNSFTIVPVPLHWYRQNWRGFNQSQLIAENLASKLSLNYAPNLLARTRYTSPQVKTVNKRARISNIDHAFSLNVPTPPNIILFDDVYTTGSTLSSASSVFPKNAHIWYLTIAG